MLIHKVPLRDQNGWAISVNVRRLKMDGSKWLVVASKWLSRNRLHSSYTNDTNDTNNRLVNACAKGNYIHMAQKWVAQNGWLKIK